MILIEVIFEKNGKKMIGAVNYKCGNETRNKLFEEFASLCLSKGIVPNKQFTIQR